jgi:hypothetical protein
MVCIIAWFFYFNTGLYDISCLVKYKISSWVPSQSSSIIQSRWDSIDGNIYSNAINNAYGTTEGNFSFPFTSPPVKSGAEIDIVNSSVNINKIDPERPSGKGPITAAFKIIVITLDRFIAESYRITLKIIFDIILFSQLYSTDLPSTISIFLRFQCPMFHLDYLFILFLSFLYLLGGAINRMNLFHVVTHRLVLKKIRDLNDRIVCQVKVENSYSVKTLGPSFFSFFGGKSKQFPLADVREIEKELISILDFIDRIPVMFKKPALAFIFDELDKIEPHIQRINNEKPAEGTPMYTQHNPSFSPEGTRARQQAIQRMLSNLKYFLTTAKAKFIFIAGREMYDASLADVSDRNFFVGSIFHDVINVDSFLSDPSDKSRNDITYMTEQYICTYLIPFEYRERKGCDLSLSSYNQYLIENFDELKSCAESPIYQRIISFQKRQMVMHLLQNFVIYLTHASNGAPKKVTNFFEKHIAYFDINTQVVEPRMLLIQKNRKNSLFLCFEQTNQHKIGLINYLASPIIYTIINSLQRYDDKLLVSASFLVDHIFKFNQFGFSWRNIESTPELLEVNKTPELRTFITTIIQYLTQNHLQELVTGLYTFRFTKRISHEIFCLSKISEEASATFNFTLDESLALKQYFHHFLYRLESRYKNIYSSGKRDRFIHSISSLHMVIGDLYFYDEEYNDAIIEYQDAVQFLRYNFDPVARKKRTPGISQFFLLIRNMLKLGFAFEKRKNYDSAFATFSELTGLLISYRNIDLDDLGLGQTVEKERKKFIQAIMPDPKFRNRFFKEVLGHRNPLDSDDKSCEKFDEYVKNWVANEANFISRITEIDPITPIKEGLLAKISSFEGIRLIYQPLLAKLQVIEKSHLGGITKADVKQVIDEFNFLQRILRKNEKYLMECDFYNKTADIIYYKNGRLGLKITDLTENLKIGAGKKHEVAQFSVFDDSKCLFSGCSKDIKENKYPCTACNLYLKGIKTFMFHNFDFDLSKVDPLLVDDVKKESLETNEFILIFRLLYTIGWQEAFINRNASGLKIIANALSDLGDTFLACLGPEPDRPAIRPDFLSAFFTLIGDYRTSSGQNDDHQKKQERVKTFLQITLKVIPEQLTDPGYKGSEKLSKPECILILYFVSAQIFKRAGEFKPCAWQYAKILYFLNEYLDLLITQVKKSKNNQEFQDFISKFQGLAEFSDSINENNVPKSIIENSLVRKAMITVFSAYDDIPSVEIYQRKFLFGKQHSRQKILLNRLTVNSDMEEINICNKTLQLKLYAFYRNDPNHLDTAEIYYQMLRSLFSSLYVSAYSASDTIYNRMLRLYFKASLNFRIFELFFANDEILVFPLKDPADIDNCEILLEYKTKCQQKINDLFANSYEALKTSNLEFATEMFKRNILRIENVISDTYFAGKQPIDLIRYLITDSIYCLQEIVKTSHTYGTSYILNFAYLSLVHDKLMRWSFYYWWYWELFDDRRNRKEYPGAGKEADEIEALVKELIGKDNIHFINPSYQCEIAIDSFYFARETHTEGINYKNIIENLSYLNDDFNDNVYHFCGAVEWFRVRNDNKIDDLKKIYEKSKVYQHRYYMKTYEAAENDPPLATESSG